MTATSTLPASQGAKRHRPRWLAPVVLLALLIAAALTVTALNRSGRQNTEDLDPANPGYSGAQGLARSLSNHGVEVTIVRSQRELLDQSIDGSTTVAVTGPNQLSARTARTALRHAAVAASLVLLDADHEVTAGMSLPVESHQAALTDVVAGCQGTDVGEGFRLGQASRAYTPAADAAATTCFPDRIDGGGAMITLPATAGRPSVTLLGDDNLITNGAILDADNAAIALRLFGHSDRLVWYVPSVADITAADSNSRAIAPTWFQPGLTLAGSAVLLLCLWRGRRLGPLVTEPLPVVVRAVETTESRGRMYRKSRDRGRALTVLQWATRKRLAAYLGLSVTSPVSSVAAAAAAVSGRDYHDVLALLDSPAAPDDSSLLNLANTLLALEKEVRGR
jgi:hypothetical protein